MCRVACQRGKLTDYTKGTTMSERQVQRGAGEVPLVTTFGPNYPTPEAEAKACREECATSWFDAWAAALLIVCVAIIPTLWLLAACGRFTIR